MVLDRNPDNFFAETEQVAFCPSHVVPGIDFSEDPLLQGRLFSYLDTQLSRLGSPNFHQLPINAPKCPFANMQRDGHMQMMVHKGRGNYEPNSIEPDGERETPAGFRTAPIPLERTKVRLRAESFKDHYSQARLFYRSVAVQEQKHMAMALTFELNKVEIPEIRKKMLGHLNSKMRSSQRSRKKKPRQRLSRRRSAGWWILPGKKLWRRWHSPVRRRLCLTR